MTDVQQKINAIIIIYIIRQTESFLRDDYSMPYANEMRECTINASCTRQHVLAMAGWPRRGAVERRAAQENKNVLFLREIARLRAEVHDGNRNGAHTHTRRKEQSERGEDCEMTKSNDTTSLLGRNAKQQERIGIFTFLTHKNFSLSFSTHLLGRVLRISYLHGPLDCIVAGFCARLHHVSANARVCVERVLQTR